MRFIQNPEPPYNMVPAHEYQRPKTESHAIWDDLDSFVSPVDGSVISDRGQLAEHNKRNGVVSADNFGPEFQAKKAAERHETLHGKKVVLERRRAMYEVMMRKEREA
jgi:hypothetical protein